MHVQGCQLQAVDYSHCHPSTLTAVVTVRLPSHRVIQIVRDFSTLHEPADLPAVLAEAIWRLVRTGWADETADMLTLLRDAHLVVPPRSAPRNTAPIPGMITQPPRPVRAAYWWASALQAAGWHLHALGQPLARGGFIAEIPDESGESILVIYPRNTPDDGSEASALARTLQWLTFDQRRYLARLIGAADTGSDELIPPTGAEWSTLVTDPGQDMQ